MISDGIILSGIFVFIFEVLFILSRINGLWGFFTGESWIEQKLFAGFVSLFIVLVLYAKEVFYWGRLIWGGLVIIGIVVFFGINWLIKELIDKYKKNKR